MVSCVLVPYIMRLILSVPPPYFSSFYSEPDLVPGTKTNQENKVSGKRLGLVGRKSKIVQFKNAQAQTTVWKIRGLI